MAFFRKLSADWRRAVAAEAAGDYAEAARHYALAGAREKVAEMHICRAERTDDPAEEIAALRDALRWADEGTEPARRAARRLAAALLARARAEGVATERDRELVREAARLWEQAGEWGEAGAAWELLGDDDAAARAYEKGGVLDRMEMALARDEKRARDRRRLKDAFEEYELHWKGGDRESARSALLRCVELAEEKGEYRRLLADLEGRRITSGRVALARRPDGRVAIVCGTPRVVIGRDPTCDLVLRAGGVSRVHAELLVDAAGFRLRDAGSRNGTLLGGLPIAGELALDGAGRFALGDDCDLAFEIVGGVLRLEVARGLDRGVVVLAAPAERAVPLEAATGLAAALTVRDGRPYLEVRGRAALRLNGARIARGAVQLVHKDVVAVGDVEAEVL